MLACFTEVASAAWRDGMIEGLTRGYVLAAEDGLRGSALLRAVIHRFNQLTPAAYHTYAGAYLHQGDLYGVMPKMLSFWQWRYLAADLAEIAQVAELLGCGPGFQEEEVRCALLLDTGTPGSAPYRSLLDHGGPADPAPQCLDGLVDGYNLCWQFVHDCDLDGDEYVAKVMEYLAAFWPDDYSLYRRRHSAMRQPSAARAADSGPPLEYGSWLALVCELAVEIDRCIAAGATLSRKRVELSCRLLCRVDEPAPSLDWTLPPKLEKELSW